MLIWSRMQFYILIQWVSSIQIGEIFIFKENYYTKLLHLWLKWVKNCATKLAKFCHSLGETELTKHWQKVRPNFGRTESSVDHYWWRHHFVDPPPLCHHMSSFCKPPLPPWRWRNMWMPPLDLWCLDYKTTPSLNIYFAGDRREVVRILISDLWTQSGKNQTINRMYS